MTRIAILTTAFALFAAGALAQTNSSPQDHEQHHPPEATSSGGSPNAQATPPAPSSPAALSSGTASAPAEGGPASSPAMGGMMQMMMQKMPEQCRAAMQNMPKNCMSMMNTMMQGGMMPGMMQGGMQSGMGQGAPGAVTQRSATPHVRAYSEAMDKMHAPMMQGVTDEDADVAFAKGMIPHHQAAIDMAQTVLKFGKDERMRKLAQDVIREQAGEIAELNEWLKKHRK